MKMNFFRRSTLAKKTLLGLGISIITMTVLQEAALAWGSMGGGGI